MNSQFNDRLYEYFSYIIDLILDTSLEYISCNIGSPTKKKSKQKLSLSSIRTYKNKKSVQWKTIRCYKTQSWSTRVLFCIWGSYFSMIQTKMKYIFNPQDIQFSCACTVDINDQQSLVASNQNHE
jgi:hypothetical protein